MQYDPPNLFRVASGNRFDMEEIDIPGELAEKKEIYVAPVRFRDKRYDYRYSEEWIDKNVKRD